MSRPTFVPETIFRRSLRLKQTDRTCWTSIQTHSATNLIRPDVELSMNFSRSVVRLMKSSTFCPGLAFQFSCNPKLWFDIKMRKTLVFWKVSSWRAPYSSMCAPFCLPLNRGRGKKVLLKSRHVKLCRLCIFIQKSKQLIVYLALCLFVLVIFAILSLKKS